MTAIGPGQPGPRPGLVGSPPMTNAATSPRAIDKIYCPHINPGPAAHARGTRRRSASHGRRAARHLRHAPVSVMITSAGNVRASRKRKRALTRVSRYISRSGVEVHAPKGRGTSCRTPSVDDVRGRAGHVERAADRPCPGEGQEQNKNKDKNKDEKKKEAEEKKDEAKDEVKDKADDREEVVDAPGTDHAQDRRRNPQGRSRIHPGADRARSPPLGGSSAARLAQTGTSWAVTPVARRRVPFGRRGCGSGSAVPGVRGINGYAFAAAPQLLPLTPWSHGWRAPRAGTPCFRRARWLRSSPSCVLGPVLLPPCNRQLDVRLLRRSF